MTTSDRIACVLFSTFTAAIVAHFAVRLVGAMG